MRLSRKCPHTILSSEVNEISTSKNLSPLLYQYSKASFELRYFFPSIPPKPCAIVFEASGTIAVSLIAEKTARRVISGILLSEVK